jgi:hypothetical protein
MTFAAPIWLAVAAAAAIGVLLAHLFSPSVPQRERLPTTRFIPEDAPLAVLRTNRLSDWLLLLLRLAVCILFGLALAGAHVPRRAPSRVVIVDASRAVASLPEARDSARAHRGDVVIVFDSIARRASDDALESLPLSNARGNLSAALVGAHRSLQGLGEGRSASELVIVSPFVREEMDSATALLLARWEGPVTLARVLSPSGSERHRVEVRAEGDDPVATAFALRPRPVEQRARVVRTRLTARDSAWAGDSAGVLVFWPASTDALDRRVRHDTAGALIAGGTVVVGSFARTQQPRVGRVIARWNDGAPAATETSLDRGCVREVAVPVDPIGDVALRASFREFAYRMVEPCGGARDFARAEMPARAAAASPAPQTPSGREPLWLALFALAALLAEQVVRARGRVAA